MARTRGSIGVKTRLKQPANDAEAARRAAAAFLQARSKLGGVNLAQVTAQMHEIECVEQLVSFMRDESLPPALRRDCCIDILTIARGKPRVWLHDGRTVDPAAPSLRDPERRTVGDDIADLSVATALYQQFNTLVSQGIHSSEWPDAVRALADPETLEMFNVVPGSIVN
jgi:hypothetical protein